MMKKLTKNHFSSVVEKKGICTRKIIIIEDFRVYTF